MAKTQKESVKKRKHQLDSLFIYLGSLVADKIEKGEISIQPAPDHPELQSEIDGLFPKIESPSASPSETAEKTNVPDSSPERRGSLEPYVDLNVKLHTAKKKFVNIRQDVNDGLSLANIHLPKDERVKAEQFVEQVDQSGNKIDALFEKVGGTIRRAIDKKKEALEKMFPGVPAEFSKAEKDFFRKTESEIRKMTQGVDTLVDEAKSLFESIRALYEADAQMRLSEEIKRNSQTVSNPPPEEKQTESVQEDSETVEEDAETAAAADENQMTSQADELKEEAVEVSDEKRLETEAMEETEDSCEMQGQESLSPAWDREFDQSIFNAVRRKLISKDTSEEDQLRVLKTCFHSMEREQVADFLIELFDEVDVLMKTKLVDLVDQVDHPELEKIYARFVTSPESLLRLKGIAGLMKGRPDMKSELMMRAAGDSEASIRRFAANCIEPENGDTEFRLVIRLTGDSDDRVARIAIRKLAGCKTATAVTELIAKLRHDNPKIRKEVIDHLRVLIGETFGYKPNAGEKEREKAVRALERFWTKQQTRQPC